MSNQNEEYFPRGGSKPKPQSSAKPRQENLFGAAPPKKKKSQTVAAKIAAKEDFISKTVALDADVLTYKKILDGMLILGCVRHIKSLYVQLELPGRTFGNLSIKHVSTPYYKELNKKLQEDTDNEELISLTQIFKEGQFVPTKVLHVSSSEEKGTVIELSTNPKDINASQRHKNYKEGRLVWGAVSEKSDHGYIMDLGVNNCRAVLPFSKVDSGDEFATGQVFYCTVTKCESSREATILTVSALKEDIDQNMEASDLSLDDSIPGMQVQYTVDKLLDHGLEGKFFNECLGYVNSMYLAKPLEQLNKYREEQVLAARIMYTQPTTKFTYLTLRSLETIESPTLKIGSRVRAKVCGKTGIGMVVKIDEHKGFVANNRLIRMLKTSESDVKKLISNKFGIGSEHNCIILDYNHMEMMYICTFEQNINEGVYTLADLQLGQTVKATIKSIISQGIMVKIGGVEGIITNEHLTGAQYSENVKKRFKVGQVLNAKVWLIIENSNTLRLTLKPDFLASKDILKSYEEAELGKQYSGLVVHTTIKGILVKFYGNVKGWLPKGNIPQLEGESAKNIFYQGQVIKCYVQKKEAEQVILSLQPSKKTVGSKKVKVGDVVNSATITNINQLGLDLVVGGNCKVFLPAEHLATGGLGQLLLATYEKGQVLTDLLCVSYDKMPIVSKRERQAFNNQNLKVLKLEDLKANVLLRASYHSHLKLGVSISVPLKNRLKRFSIFNNDLMDDSEDIKFAPQQPIIAKVLKVEDDKYTFSSKLSDVFDYNYMYSVNLLETYLDNINFLREKLILQNEEITKLSIGQKVKCIVNKVDKEKGCSVFIQPYNIQGVVQKAQCLDSINPKDTVEGVILWINYKYKVALLTLKKAVIDRISLKQGEEINENLLNSTCYGDILLVDTEFAVGVLRNEEVKGHIVYLPVKLHENDFSPDPIYYNKLINTKVKIVLCKNSNNNLIGIEKGFKKIMEEKAKFIKSKIVLTESGTLEFARKRKNLKRKIKGDPNVATSKQQKLIQVDKVEIKSESESDAEDTMEVENVPEKGNKEEQLDSGHSSLNEDNDSDVEMKEESQSGDEKNVGEEESTNSSDGDFDEIDDSDDADASDLEAEIDSDNSLEVSDNEDNDKAVVSTNGDVDSDADEDMSDDHDAGIKKVVIKNIQKNNKNKVVKSVVVNADGGKPILPGIGNFFKNSTTEQAANNESSDEEEKNATQEQKKKKRLTPAERADVARAEEERLRKIETDLADSTSLPQSAEQFDRILLGNPDDSEMWLRYIAHHAQATEFEKARAVIKRSLSKISYTATQERLNVWLAYLNLENMYGTKDTFEKVFEEASRCNDSLTIYLESIKILSEMQKFTEMDEKIKKVRAKFKQDLKMWLEVGKVYYQCKRYADARKLKDIALVTVNDKKTHIDLIVQFAIMEFNHGEPDQGEALFETIIQTDPKRVDVWNTYVDQLTKIDKLDVARNVLNRAIGQKLPYKKMRALFKKYHFFEKKHGNEENLERLKKIMKDYVHDLA